MLKLPKIKDRRGTKDVCKCRPICKSRRREWKGEIHKTSAELVLERKPIQECFRRWPSKVHANSLCPLFARKHRLVINERNASSPPNIVRICQTPLDDKVDTPYIKFAEMAKKLGAWDAVISCCAFCNCGICCACRPHNYEIRAESWDQMRANMRSFDARVKDCIPMRIMYDIL
ncbi:uncharacterized protein LOC113402070 [Vanessa tameamea]|uniref:Uncharacterized protein LOC113402070 n=1 Tax=Vanessa tameamea TaxID=334116 RepID=A0A8B8ILJ9_VANTA